MKNLVLAVFVFSIVLTACSKKETAGFAVQEDVKVQYDTVAIDSFSNGAASMDVVRRIKMSSQAYQDSLKEAKKIQDQEKKLKEELEKDNKKKLEEENKKTDEGKQKASSASTKNETKSE